MCGDDPVSSGVRRLKVFAGAGTLRIWSDVEKASILAQCRPGGERDAVAARRYALDAYQRYGCSKEMVSRCKGHGAVALGQKHLAFGLAVIAPDATLELAPEADAGRQGPRRSSRRSAMHR